MTNNRWTLTIAENVEYYNVALTELPKEKTRLHIGSICVQLLVFVNQMCRTVVTRCNHPS